MTNDMPLPFDRVVVRGDGDPRELSAREFLGLPLHERIRMILQRNLEFFDGDGTVDRSEALKSLRALQDHNAA